MAAMTAYCVLAALMKRCVVTARCFDVYPEDGNHIRYYIAREAHFK
jgi:hypothetical protein